MSVTLRGWSVFGTTKDATAETPNAIDPAMLSAAITHGRSCGRQDHHVWVTANNAIALATRKQIDPKASGDHTSLFSWVAERWRAMASKVEMLKNSVPASWIAPADQSRFPGAHARQRPVAVWYCSAAALVKKIEPTKNVMPSAATPTRLT